MKTINKKQLDELIRLVRKSRSVNDEVGDYWKLAIHQSMAIAESTLKNQYAWDPFLSIVGAIMGPVIYRFKPNATNKDVYAVFELLGYEICGGNPDEE